MAEDIVLKFDHRGNLSPGIIKSITLDEFQDFFINSFTDSETRESIYKGFQNFINEIKRLNIFEAMTKIWLDGSYVTSKENPNDIDFVFFLDALHPSSSLAIANKQEFRDFGEQVHCDPYFTVDYRTLPEEARNERHQLEAQEKYWLGQFCFDRNEDPKGIIELTKEKLW